MAQLSDVTLSPALAAQAVQLQLDNLMQPVSADLQPPDTGFPFNEIAVRVLRKRVADARQAGNKNVAVGVDLLIELFNGTEHGMKNGFTSQVQV